MTDEEKAEEYTNSINTLIYDIEDNAINIAKYLRKAYLAGLAEGRKELEQWKQEWQDAQIKANEEGFTRTILQIKCSDLIKENEELKKDKEYLDKVNNEQTEVILKLNDQIEKMKCCKNCKHSFSEGMGCMQRARQNWCHNYALWELAE